MTLAIDRPECSARAAIARPAARSSRLTARTPWSNLSPSTVKTHVNRAMA